MANVVVVGSQWGEMREKERLLIGYQAEQM